MADRYLRATGNWNGSVWAATSGGTAGSAAAPTSSDNVYIAANFTVMLTADAVCKSLTHTNGVLSIGEYNLTVGNSVDDWIHFSSTGTTARTINIGSGTLRVYAGKEYTPVVFQFTGSNLSFNPGDSIVQVDISYGGIGEPSTFATGSKTFNDVKINMGYGFADSTMIDITGSPTFRLLDIRSANTAAHTVSFSDFVVNVSKLVAIGSSTSNRLTLTSSWIGEYNEKTKIVFTSNGSSYGENVALDGVNHGNSPDFPAYIGSSSIETSSGGTGGISFVLDDPPKIATLVDPLTTAPGSNTNFTVTGTINQLTTGSDGGGYEFASSTLVSNDTYDLVDSSLILEVLGGEYATGEMLFKALSDTFAGVYMSSSPLLYEYSPYTGYGDSTELGVTLPTYIKISLSSSTRVLEISVHDGSSWTNTYSFSPMPVEDVALWRSGRLEASGSNIGMPGHVKLQIGYINPAVSGASPGGNMLMMFM